METKTKEKKNSLVGKGFIVLLIAGLLQIPILLVSGLIKERKELSESTMMEVSKSWGEEMEVMVPTISIPFYEFSVDKNGKTESTKKVRAFASSGTEVEGRADVEILHRSIYDIPVYRTDLSMKGTFRISSKSLENPAGSAYVTLPVNSYRGLEGYPVININGKGYKFEVTNKELRAYVPREVLDSSLTLIYTIQIKSKGINRLSFNPGGKDFKVSVKSNYPSPSFNGDYLPSSRNISKEGFAAQWDVTELNACNSGAYSRFNVDFVVTADQYQQTERSIKYSFLFIILVLCGIFLVECVTRCRISIVQYIVTGLSLSLFYLLLLSISEYLQFGWAYMIAATMTTCALGGYFYGFLKSKVAIAFTITTAILYAFIFMLLQMETGSLLVGSFALFIILGVIMFFTRNQYPFGSKPQAVIEE